jgi:hypothetical protein
VKSDTCFEKIKRDTDIGKLQLLFLV